MQSHQIRHKETVPESLSLVIKAAGRSQKSVISGVGCHYHFC